LSGIQEILLVVLLVLVVVFLPRLRSSRRPPPPGGAKARPLSGRMRLAIVASILWPVAAAAVTKPWAGDGIRFVYVGLAPVGVAWALRWVLTGFRQPGRRR
jgi:hypothetical protein